MKRTLLTFVGLLILASVAIDPANADCVLKQSTASQTIQLPRFVDSTDGVTPETGLTIANTDIKIGKPGGTTQTNKNSGGATHIATGDYYITLDATDTNTVGNLHIVIAPSGALPVWVDCMVVEEAVYDAQFGASALGYVANAPVSVAQVAGSNVTATSGRMEVNVSHFGGTAGAFASGRPEVNSSHIGGSAISQSSGVANVNVAQVSTDSAAADTFETWLDGTAGSAMPIGIVDQGTAQSATATTLVLRSALAMGDDTANGMTLVACGSTQTYCQSRAVTDYVSSTDTATVDTWTVTPSGTITYYLFGTAPSSGSGPTAATIADAVWDEDITTHTTSSSTGERLGRVPNAAAGGSGGLPTLNASSRVNADMVAISTDSTAADNAESFFDGTGYAGTGNTIPTVTSVTNQVTANMTQISGDTSAADNLENSFDDTAGANRWTDIVDQGTAQAATGTTIRLRAAAAFADSELVGARVVVTGGSAGVGQSRLITAYSSATDTATVSAWTTTPTGTITYQVKSDTAAAGGSAPTAAEVADAVWDESTSGHTTSGTFGEQVKTDIDDILVDTGTTLDGKLNTVDDFLDTEIAAMKAKIDQMTFTVSGQLDVNVESMNAEAVCGTGDAGSAWKGCP